MLIIFWHQGNCSQRIRPGRPNSQFCILLWRFLATAWKCAKASPRTFATKELAVASQQCTASHSFFTREFLTKNNMTVVPHPPYLPDLAPCDFPLFPQLMIKLEDPVLTQFRWSRQNWRRCWPPSQNTTSSMHLTDGRSAGNGAYVRKGTTWRVMVVGSFWPDGSTSPGNYGYHHVNWVCDTRLVNLAGGTGTAVGKYMLQIVSERLGRFRWTVVACREVSMLTKFEKME
jgi:hypothetical protein